MLGGMSYQKTTVSRWSYLVKEAEDGELYQEMYRLSLMEMGLYHELDPLERLLAINKALTPKVKYS